MKHFCNVECWLKKQAVIFCLANFPISSLSQIDLGIHGVIWHIMCPEKIPSKYGANFMACAS